MGEKAAVAGAKRTLRVAAVQMVSEAGKIADNLKRATGFVEEASRRGAKLILLPEFMPIGYCWSVQIWNSAESRQGPTVRWLTETSKRLGVWVGTSYLEADGNDFYNTFVLTNPDGLEDGRVRKHSPALGEACFTRGGVDSQIIDTQLGRVGVAICYDNHFAYTSRNMFSQSVDLMLQPHTSPTASVNMLTSQKVADFINERIRKLPVIYADMLGIPVILCNRAGYWHSPAPALGAVVDIPWDGHSAIVDSDGTIKAQLGMEEGVIVEDVVLDPARKKRIPPPSYGKWAMPNVPTTMRNWPLIESAISIWYKFNNQRRLKAREMSR